MVNWVEYKQKGQNQGCHVRIHADQSSAKLTKFFLREVRCAFKFEQFIFFIQPNSPQKL